MSFRISVVSVLAFLGLVTMSGLSSGQGFFPQRGDQPGGRLIQPPRSLQQRLRDAEDAIRENRPSDAVLALGNLVARDTGDLTDSELAQQDFFLDSEDAREGVPAGKSLLQTARRMIGQLSQSDWEAYQLRFGPTAARLMQQASQSRDWETVEKVRRCYLHTLAGYQATALLAQREIYRGHSLTASLLLDDVVQIPRAVKELGPEIVLMHAVTRDAAGRSLLDLEQSPVSGLFFGKPMKVQTRNTATDSAVPGSNAQSTSLTLASMAELKDWLGQRPQSNDRYRRPPPTDHAFDGSLADRNGNSSGQMPLSNMRWELPTTASQLQEKMVRDYTGQLGTAGALPPPSWMPLRVGNQLLMRTTERVVGVDYQTGKRLWTYPWQSGPEPVEEQEVLFIESGPGEVGDDDRIGGRIFNDVPYGQISSDGQRAFMLTDLADLELVSLSRFRIVGTRPTDGSGNTLVALEMKTEGKLLWRIGQSGDPASSLANAFFLGPPLPLDGRLYVMAELSGDILLCCLDPQSGQELWRQHLLAIESGGIQYDAIRRICGAVPTYHEGMMICPTGAGACVAVRLVDRMLDWAAIYNRSNQLIRVTNRRRGLEAKKLMDRWHNGTAIGSGLGVFVTPPEADRLFGFHLLSGKQLFQYKNRVGMRYLAGVRDNQFILVGADQIRAYNAETGSPAWSSPDDFLATGQHVAGRGVFGQDDYIVPTTTGELVRVSTTDGKVLQRRSTRYPLGNLVAIDGDIIVQGATQLSVAFGEKSLQPKISRRLAANPDDFEAMVRMSQLLIEQGKQRDALQLLRRARVMQPSNDEVHTLSVSAMLGVLRDAPELGEEYIAELTELIDQPSQRLELLSLRLLGAMKNEDWTGAMDHAMDLSALVATESPIDTVVEEIIDDPARYCGLDCWLATRVGEIRSRCNAVRVDEINARIRQRSVAKINQPGAVLAKWVRHLEGWAGIAAARQALATRHRGENQWLAAEKTLLGPQSLESLVEPLAVGSESETGVGTVAAGNTGLRPSRLLELSEVFLFGGLTLDAKWVLDRLRSTPMEQPQTNRIDKLQKQIAAAIPTAHQWPDRVSLNWKSQRLNAGLGRVSGFYRVAKTVAVSGRHFSDWHLTSQVNLPMGMRTPLGTARPIAAEGIRANESRDDEALIAGGAMIVTTPTGLLCVDLYEMLMGGNPLKWWHSFGNDGSGTATPSPMSTPLGDRIFRRRLNTARAQPLRSIPELYVGPVVGDRCFVLQGGDLLALDILTGELLWRNSDAPKNGLVLSDGQRVAVISDSANQIVFFQFGDGQRLTSADWTHGKLWKAAGRHVLCYASGKNRSLYDIRLLDPFTNRVLLEQQSFGLNRSRRDTASGMGNVVDGRYLLWMQSDGQALIWDILTGQEIARPELPALENLVGISAMRLGDRFFFLPKLRREQRKQPADRQVATTGDPTHRTVDAVFAVNRDDGKIAWSRQFDQPWGCTLNQPADTPLLMLTRSPIVTSLSTTVRKKYLDVLALSVRNGETVKERLEKEIAADNNMLQTELVVQPKQNTLRVKIGNDENLTFRFGDDTEDSDEREDDSIESLQRQLQLEIPKPVR